MNWTAGVFLLFGCGATATDPSVSEDDGAIGHKVLHRPFPPAHPPRPTAHFPGHFPRHFPGHPGPGSPGAGGTFGGGGLSSGSGATTSSGGFVSAAGATNGSGGTFIGSGGTFIGGAGSVGVEGVCGDGVLTFDEQCDDGNTASGDGCDPLCGIEPGYACPYGEPCRPVACGDGSADSYPVGNGLWVTEACDDGNTASGDGCSSSCEPEAGFICFDPGEQCKHVVCGDGAVDPYYVIVEGTGGTAGSGSVFAAAGSGGAFGAAGSGSSGGPGYGYGYEGCDDGNTTSGDGCSSTCEAEAGWICDYPGEACRKPRCGDGFIDFIPGAGGPSGSAGSGSGAAAGSGSAGSGNTGTYEECDDANDSSGDGCSATCTIEPGYSCITSGVLCKRAVCGDGITDYPVESCDDGNRKSNDGCSSTCQGEWFGAGGFSGIGGNVSTPTAGQSFGIGGRAGSGG